MFYLNQYKSKKYNNNIKFDEEFLVNLSNTTGYISPTFSDSEIYFLEIGGYDYQLHIYDDFDSDRLLSEHKDYQGIYTWDHNIYISKRNCSRGDSYVLNGVLHHEIFHAIQHQLCRQGISGWYDLLENSMQDKLYHKHLQMFAGTYADTSPAEAAAEVFRVLSGYYSNGRIIEWERSDIVLDDYGNFFSQIEQLKHMSFNLPF